MGLDFLARKSFILHPHPPQAPVPWPSYYHSSLYSPTKTGNDLHFPCLPGSGHEPGNWIWDRRQPLHSAFERGKPLLTPAVRGAGHLTKSPPLFPDCWLLSNFPYPVLLACRQHPKTINSHSCVGINPTLYAAPALRYHH